MATRTDLANAIRALAMDAVQKANSGHPGMPMGMAEIAETLWNGYLRHHPANPAWPDRDRFVLSNGHGSMLQYALLHLSGYDLPIEEIKRFRQLHSKTPGHPEHGLTPGVETTTGPLGQGISNAVGMAIAERLLAAEFNRPGYQIVDHYTYVFLGDGCLMEGISHESCSLAGTLGLGKLIAFYDDNGISIDGHVSGWFSDDTPKRFEAYHWHVVRDVDGHDVAAVDKAIKEARGVTDRPTLICCKTVIGKGAALESAWNAKFEAYARAFPKEAGEFTRRMKGDLPATWRAQAEAFVSKVNEKAETIASRKASQNAIEGLAPLLPELVGGSADLAGSNLTLWSGSKGVAKSGGNYLYYGVREFGMSAIMNGMTLHGGIIPYGGTFLTFSDYSRNALRMAALMKIRGLFVFTHDSIGLGEDGPTHQSVEHASALRLIPHMDVWRPCDSVESALSWVAAIERKDGPASLLFSRQNLPFQVRSAAQIAQIRRGGYVLADADKPKVVIIATGSEVALAMDAKKVLDGQGIPARVVSMPCTGLFDRQDAAYRDSVLPKGVRRVAVEAGVTDFWRKYVGLEGAVVGIDRFGESAPGGELFKFFGITVDAVVAAAKSAA